MIYRSPFTAKSRQTTAFKKSGNWKLGYHTGIDRVCDTDRTLVAIADGVLHVFRAVVRATVTILFTARLTAKPFFTLI